MVYCTKCGTRLPEDEQAKFCPSCGAPIALRLDYTIPTRPSAEKKPRTAALRSRLIVTLIVFALCVGVTSAGTLAKVESSEAQGIVQEWEKVEEALETAGVQIIFGNNLMYCLVMFIPVLGPLNGFYVLYSTGKVLAAFGSTAGADPLLLFLSLFIYPHTWLEYVSYSLAISESLWLLFLTLKHRLRGFRGELSNASRAIAICTVLLLLGAFAEIALISVSS